MVNDKDSWKSLHREQTVELGINHVRHRLQLLWTIAELTGVSVNDDELSLIAANPLLITL